MTPTGPLPTKTKEVADLQDKLAKEAEKVPGVNKAWVVLSGGTALVGTELKSDIPRGSPVSYTHLDVYKRQVRRFTNRAGKTMLFTSWWLVFSVSYIIYA